MKQLAKLILRWGTIAFVMACLMLAVAQYWPTGTTRRAFRMNWNHFELTGDVYRPRGDRMASNGATWWGGPGLFYAHDSFWPSSQTGFDHYRVEASGWWVMLPVLTLGLAHWIAWWDRRRERLSIAAGMCHVCGYDLRATPERCPECGMVVEPLAKPPEDWRNARPHVFREPA